MLTKTIRRLLLLVAATAISWPAFADDKKQKSDELNIEEVAAALDKAAGLVKTQVKVPAYGLKFVEMANGIKLMATEDGRYVCAGQIYNGWKGRQEFTSVAQISKDASTADLKGYGIRYNDTGTFLILSIGKSGREIVVMLDPLSKHTPAIIKGLKVLADQKKVRFLVMPTPTTKNSVKAATVLGCMKPEQALRAIEAARIPTKAPGKCDQKASMDKVTRNYSLFTLMRFGSVPVSIDVDQGGRVIIGYERKGYAQWLDQANGGTNKDNAGSKREEK